MEPLDRGHIVRLDIHVRGEVEMESSSSAVAVGEGRTLDSKGAE